MMDAYKRFVEDGCESFRCICTNGEAASHARTSRERDAVDVIYCALGIVKRLSYGARLSDRSDDNEFRSS